MPKYAHYQFTDVYGLISENVWIHPSDFEKPDIQERKLVETFNDFCQS
jgi:hypothetical protein